MKVPKDKGIHRKVIEKKVTYVGKTKNIKFWPKEDIEKYDLQIIAFGRS